MTEKYVIIGGVAGGASVATRLRRLNEDAQIVIYEAGLYISFANCGLPYYIGKKITERQNLLVESVADLQQDFQIEVHVNSEVVKIDPQNKQLTIKENSRNTQTNYDKLILSPGAKPIIPTFPGLNMADNVFTVRNIPDVDRIKKYLEQQPKAQHACIVGGGFIGLEMAENLHDLGMNVTLIEARSQVMPNLDFEMAQFVHQHLQANGVKLLLNTKLTGFAAGGKQLLLAEGQQLKADIVILALGIKPNSQLAKAAGIKTDQRGFITVDEHFQTSLPSIYAIGDVIAVKNAVTSQLGSIALAGPANRQGRYLADQLQGIDHPNPAVWGTAVAKIFALTVAATGATERQLQASKIPFQALHLHPNSHAGYYPGAAPIEMKVLIGVKGEILGAQAVGTNGVDKRIDVIATAANFGAHASQLADIEIAYAPPYASAKDPVNYVGYLANNLQQKLVKTIQWHQVDPLLRQQAVFLDVRTPDELLAEAPLPGAITIERSQIRNNLAKLPKNKPLYVYCSVGLRGYNVCRILQQHGFDVYNLDGGLKTYQTGKYDPTIHQPQRNLTAKKPIDPSKAKMAETIELDACGLQCPGPILKVKEQMSRLSAGQKLRVTASDFGFCQDIAAWAAATKNTLVKNEIKGNQVVAVLQKKVAAKVENSGKPTKSMVEPNIQQGTTMVVFDGDFDKAIASLIIAQGAAAMGQPVTMFFTFWGLSIIRKPDVKLAKQGAAKLFDQMLPRGTAKLNLSKMNFGGIGRNLMKKIMRNNQVDQLEIMLKKAQQAGVKMVACTMSMNLMGITAAELIDNVELGGVATYLGDASQRNTNLFI